MNIDKLMQLVIVPAFIAACGGGGGGGGSDCIGCFSLDATLSVAVGDFNSDGFLDIAAGRYFLDSDVGRPAPSWVEVMLQDRLTPGSFQQGMEYSIGGEMWTIIAGDINSDGLPDLVSANVSTDNISILRNRSGSPGSFQGATEQATALGPDNVAIGDLNGDGVPDLAVSDNRLSLLLQDSSGSGSYTRQTPIDQGSSHVEMADLNLDGRMDLIFTVVVSGDFLNGIQVRLQDPLIPADFLPAQDYLVEDQPVVVAAADLNGDGFDDVAVGSSPPSSNSGPHLTVFLNDPGVPGSLLTPTTYQTCTFAKSLVIVDVNNDSRPDIVVSGGRNQEACVAVHLQTASFNGTFQTPTFYTGSGPGGLVSANSVATGDLNGDGLVDIVLADEGIGVFFQDPASPGTFQAQTRLLDDV
jgi:hypothetical protein